jgi:uncharacterized hydantoinase/oxoprolinase family protein
VHLILGNLSEKDYTVETADGKEKTRKAALARLARVVCADTEMLSEEQIIQIAKYVYDMQIEQITAALVQIRSRIKKKVTDNFATVVTGLGRNFLGKKAASKAGFQQVVDFDEFVGDDVARVSTAFATALLGATQIEGRIGRWTQ